MPKRKNQRILAIDPGTRETGVAVLDGRELIFYGVRTFKRRKPVSILLKEVNRVMQKLIDEYDPSELAIETTFFYKNKCVSHLINVAEEMKTIAKRNKLKVVEYAPKTIRKHICKSGKATKKETARVLCSRFPELCVYLTQDRKWKVDYWSHLYDAVAVGVTHLEMGEDTK